MSKFATKYDHEHTLTRVDGDSLAKAEFADECDIRTIIQRHSLAPTAVPTYVDMTLFGDGLQDVLEFSRHVAGVFDSLPVAAREFFNFDPEKAVAFLSDDSNRDKAIELGLIPPSEPVFPRGNEDDSTPTPAPATPSTVNKE